AVFRVHERLDVRVVAAQHRHLRAAPRTGGLDGLARLVEHVHVGQRPAGAAVRALDVGALRSDAREVVADTAPSSHRLRGLVQRRVDAHLAVVAGNGIADWLHEAVDQRGLEIRAGRGVDAPAEDQAIHLRLEKRRLPTSACLGAFDLGECTGDAPSNVVGRTLVALRIFLAQHVGRDGLRRERARHRARLIPLGDVAIHNPAHVMVVRAEPRPPLSACSNGEFLAFWQRCGLGPMGTSRSRRAMQVSSGEGYVRLPSCACHRARGTSASRRARVIGRGVRPPPVVRVSSGEGYARLAPCECHRARGMPASASYSRRSGGHSPDDAERFARVTSHLVPWRCEPAPRARRDGCVRRSACFMKRRRTHPFRRASHDVIALTRRAGTFCAAGRVRTPERLLYEAEADAPVPTRLAWRNRIDAMGRHSVCGGTGAYAGAPAVRSGGGRTRSDAPRMTWYVLTRRAGTPCAEGRVRTPERLLHDAEADAPVPTRFAEHTVTRLNGRRAQAAAAIRRQCSSAAPIRLRLASAVRKPEWAESVTFGSVRKGWLAGSGSMA